MPQDVNAIMPTQLVLQTSSLQKITKTVVVLNPDEAHHISGEKGSQDEKMMPSKAQVMELATAVGVSITESHEVASPIESKRHPNIVTWMARGHVDNGNGQKTTDTSNYSLDMRYQERDGTDGSVILLEIADNLSTADKVRSGEWRHSKGQPAKDASDEEWYAWARKKALDALKRRDRFRDQLAETGAKLRLVRSFCSLQTSYPRKTLEKPFVVYKATVDLTRALEAGGPVGQAALTALSGLFARSLGLDPGQLPMPDQKMLTESKGVDFPKDLDILTDAEIDQLEADMIASGFKDRAMCDRKTTELFGATMSNLTKRHEALIRELIELSTKARETIGKEELPSFNAHINTMAPIAYMEATTIHDVMEQRWYDKLYQEEEEIKEEGDVIVAEAVGYSQALVSLPEMGDDDDIFC